MQYRARRIQSSLREFLANLNLSFWHHISGQPDSEREISHFCFARSGPDVPQKIRNWDFCGRSGLLQALIHHCLLSICCSTPCLASGFYVPRPPIFLFRFFEAQKTSQSSLTAVFFSLESLHFILPRREALVTVPGSDPRPWHLAAPRSTLFELDGYAHATTQRLRGWCFSFSASVMCITGDHSK